MRASWRILFAILFTCTLAGAGIASEQGVLYLSELQPLGVLQTWGTLGLDRSVGGQPLRLGGQEYSRGLGSHANSEISFYLGGEARWLEAEIGIDDEVPASSPCNGASFALYGDGRLLGLWGPLGPADAALAVRAAVGGVSVLKLVTADMGDNGSDHTDWANARLLTREAAASARLRAANRERVEYVVAIPEPGSSQLTITCRLSRPVSFPWEVVICADVDPPATFRGLGPPGVAVVVEDVERGKRWRLRAPASPWIGFEVTRHINPYHFRGQDKHIQHLGADFGILDGHYLFPGPEEMWREAQEASLRYAVRVRFELPQGWRPVTPWEEQEGWLVPQTPASLSGAFGVFPASAIHLQSRPVGKTDLMVAMPGKDNAALQRAILDKLANLMAYYQALWGEFPYRRYLVLYSPRTPDGLWVYTSSGSHANSFVAPPGSRDWYYLAHEMHHSFNNLVFRSHRDLVWYGECCNEYFPLRARCALGLQAGSFEENLRDQHYRNYRTRVLGTAFDVPITRGDDYLNTNPPVQSALIYSKSCCIAFLMDRRLRELSGAKRTLDDFARYAFQQAMRSWPTKRGLPSTLEELQQQLETFSGASWQQFFDDYVRGTKPLPLDRYLPAR